MRRLWWVFVLMVLALTSVQAEPVYIKKGKLAMQGTGGYIATLLEEILRDSGEDFHLVARDHSGVSPKSSHDGARITRCWSANPASVKPPLPRVLPR